MYERFIKLCLCSIQLALSKFGKSLKEIWARGKLYLDLVTYRVNASLNVDQQTLKFLCDALYVHSKFEVTQCCAIRHKVQVKALASINIFYKRLSSISSHPRLWWYRFFHVDHELANLHDMMVFLGGFFFRCLNA